MSIPRFYCPDLISTQAIQEFQLPDDEANHALKALRMRPEQHLVVFDGKGNCWQAIIVATSSKHVTCRTLTREFSPLVLARHTTLAVAFPKGDRQRAVIEKLVEFGIQRLVPLESARSVAEAKSGAMARWQRYSLEACKQSGRNLDLEITSPQTISQLIEDGRATDVSTWLAHPYDLASSTTQARPVEYPLEEVQVPPSPLCFVIGPEGGFTDQEVEMAHQAGWRRLSLGPRILRVENAVAFCCAMANLDQLGERVAP